MTENGQTTRNKVGAPHGNANALKHGQRSVTLGKLPKPASYVQKLVSRFRVHQERLAREQLQLADGEPLPDRYERRINTAAVWEQKAQLAQLQLRLAMDKLSPAEVVQMADYVATSREKRDEALRGLGMDNATAATSEPHNGPALLYGGGE